MKYIHILYIAIGNEIMTVHTASLTKQNFYTPIEVIQITWEHNSFGQSIPTRHTKTIRGLLEPTKQPSLTTNTLGNFYQEEKNLFCNDFSLKIGDYIMLAPHQSYKIIKKQGWGVHNTYYTIIESILP